MAGAFKRFYGRTIGKSIDTDIIQTPIYSGSRVIVQVGIIRDVYGISEKFIPLIIRVEIIVVIATVPERQEPESLGAGSSVVRLLGRAAGEQRDDGERPEAPRRSAGPIVGCHVVHAPA